MLNRTLLFAIVFYFSFTSKYKSWKQILILSYLFPNNFPLSIVEWWANHRLKKANLRHHHPFPKNNVSQAPQLWVWWVAAKEIAMATPRPVSHPIVACCFQAHHRTIHLVAVVTALDWLPHLASLHVVVPPWVALQPAALVLVSTNRWMTCLAVVIAVVELIVFLTPLQNPGLCVCVCLCMCGCFS